MIKNTVSLRHQQPKTELEASTLSCYDVELLHHQGDTVTNYNN